MRALTAAVLPVHEGHDWLYVLERADLPRGGRRPELGAVS